MTCCALHPWLSCTFIMWDKTAARNSEYAFAMAREWYKLRHFHIADSHSESPEPTVQERSGQQPAEAGRVSPRKGLRFPSNLGFQFKQKIVKHLKMTRRPQMTVRALKLLQDAAVTDAGHCSFVPNRRMCSSKSGCSCNHRLQGTRWVRAGPPAVEMCHLGEVSRETCAGVEAGNSLQLLSFAVNPKLL